jgi:response regulator RpfG family c-di-GMP phosphodiesterase
VVKVADVFNALQSDRPYRKGWSLDRILDYMHRQRGAQFDPDCIDALFRQLDSILSINSRFSDEAGLINL